MPLQQTAVKPANCAVQTAATGFGPVEPDTSLPGQSPVPTLFQLPIPTSAVAVAGPPSAATLVRRITAARLEGGCQVPH